MRSLFALLIALVMWLQVAMVTAAPATGKSTRTIVPRAKCHSKSASAIKTKAKRDQISKPAKGKKSPLIAVKGKPVKITMALKEANPKPEEPKIPDDAYTSVVIDASGFKLDKAMGPKILRRDGSEVWGTLKNLKDEDYSFLEEHGMVAYVATVEEAKASPRCGLRPLIVKAAQTAGGKPMCSPVVEDIDADLVLSENAKGRFLEKFNVILVRNENPQPSAPAPNL
jgi:hypothetical protein